MTLRAADPAFCCGAPETTSWSKHKERQSAQENKVSNFHSCPCFSIAIDAERSRSPVDHLVCAAARSASREAERTHCISQLLGPREGIWSGQGDATLPPSGGRVKPCEHPLLRSPREIHHTCRLLSLAHVYHAPSRHAKSDAALEELIETDADRNVAFQIAEAFACDCEPRKLGVGRSRSLTCRCRDRPRVDVHHGRAPYHAALGDSSCRPRRLALFYP